MKPSLDTGLGSDEIVSLAKFSDKVRRLGVETLMIYGLDVE